jgi:uncharacterized protein YndB with AHSA1/START domain
MNQPTTDTAVRVSVDVDASQEHAFDVFTRQFNSWWPASHHIGEQDFAEVVIEPRAGGRWYERAADGTECDWGSVLEWDPPNRIVLAWQLTPEFAYDPDTALATEVEVRFTAISPTATHVALEHRGFEVHGDRGESMRASVAAPGGWGGLLQLFAAAV